MRPAGESYDPCRIAELTTRKFVSGYHYQLVNRGLGTQGEVNVDVALDFRK